MKNFAASISIILFTCSTSFAQQNNFWPSQLGMALKQVNQNISDEYKVSKIDEKSGYIIYDKVFIISRQAQIIAQAFDERVYIIKVSFSNDQSDLFKELNSYFTKKYGKSIHPYKNEMYNDEIANESKVAFWNTKKYSLMMSLSTSGMTIQYLDKELYSLRQRDWAKYQDEQKKKL